MDARYVLLRFSQIILAILFDQVRVAHANVGIVVIENYFRLTPLNYPTFRTIRFYASAQPNGIAIFVCVRTLCWMLSNKAPPVIVKPVEVASIGAAPGEVSRSWVFKKSSIGEFFILRIGPGAAAVARVGAGWMAVDRSVDTVKRSV